MIQDCPGFDDTDAKQDLANAFFIHRVFETSKLVKFILVIEESLIAAKKS